MKIWHCCCISLGHKPRMMYHCLAEQFFQNCLPNKVACCYKPALNILECSSSALSPYHYHCPPPSSLFSPLTVIAVFWLPSRCHEETTTMAPLCQSTSLPEECLFNAAVPRQRKHNVFHRLVLLVSLRLSGSFQLGVIAISLHFPD